MRTMSLIIAGLFLLAACATTPPVKQAKYEAFCRTHARHATFSGSPDEEAPYLECMHIKGLHEVEVKELEE